MKKLVLALVMALLFIITIGAPRLRDANEHPTKYNWYRNKYGNFWELADSSRVMLDTIYTYKVGAQSFVFNQNGELLVNYHVRVW